MTKKNRTKNYSVEVVSNYMQAQQDMVKQEQVIKRKHLKVLMLNLQVQILI